MTAIFRYYIYIILSVVTFLFRSSITLNKDLNHTVSVVVVGEDNLIHPEVYRNAQVGKMDTILNQYINLLKRIFKEITLHLSIKSHF